MSSQLNLKEIERKAYRSTFQDGLWDMYLGAIVACMSLFMYRPPEGYGAVNTLVYMFSFFLAYSFFKAGKKYITLPRMGQVRFGAARKQKGFVLSIILAVIVVVQGGLVLLTAFGWQNPGWGQKVLAMLNNPDLERLLVAVLGSLFVGLPMLLIAHFRDYTRGYYIAVLMSLAIFLMILTNSPIYPLILGGLIFLPGLVLFVQFLREYPLIRDSANG